jgi:DNA-binding transcriptional LysR family regulator
MNLAAVDTNLVVALDALLSEKSVTRAAKRLGLGQSATSHALSRLRTLLDGPLLVRVGRDMVLRERARVRP